MKTKMKYYNMLLFTTLILLVSSCLPPPDSFDPDPIVDPPNESIASFALSVSSAYASGDDGNVPMNTLDGNLSTRWSSRGIGEWITFSLNDTYEIESINISWYMGTTRVWYFDILYSEDGLSWFNVYSGESNGYTNNPEHSDIMDAAAKYVRILGKGNNQTTWNSITTVTIIGNHVDENTVYLDYSNQTAPSAVCGNNVIETGEECDDGTANGNVCSPPSGGSCNYCSSDCKLNQINDTVISPSNTDYQIIELSEYATIRDGPFNIVHDRRANNNLSVNAPWIYETLGGSYASLTPLRFSFQGSQQELSVWVRYYQDRTASKGWKLTLSNGTTKTINTEILQEYVWVEAYRGIFAGTINAELSPLGPRSKIDTIVVTNSRDSVDFDAMLNLTKPEPVPSAKYYVAMEGSDSNTGSINSPFRTIQKAVNSAQPGDTVLIREGTYGGFRLDYREGIPGKWTTVKAYPGERVILDAHISSNLYGVIEINNPTSYWIFDGFEITDSNPQLDEVRKLDLRDSVDETTWRQTYTELRDMRAVRMYRGTTRQASSNLIFKNLEVYNLFTVAFSGNTDFTQYINNHVYDTGYPQSGYAWYTSGNGNIYKNNIVHDSTRASQVNSPGNLGSNHIYDSNLYYRNGRTHWFHVSSSTVKRAATVLVIITSDGVSPKNNTIINNIFLYNGNGPEDKTQNGLIAHNTFIANGGLSSSNFALLLRGSNTRVMNNVFFENRANIQNEGSGYIFTTNTESATSSYEDPYKLKFGLLNSAPALDAGTSLNEVRKDFYNNPRPSGTNWDMGAVER